MRYICQYFGLSQFSWGEWNLITHEPGLMELLDLADGIGIIRGNTAIRNNNVRVVRRRFFNQLKLVHLRKHTGHSVVLAVDFYQLRDPLLIIAGVDVAVDDKFLG